MPANPREIRRRIKSTQSIAKITKAMELVSAAKMRKAQASATSSRAYSTMSSELLRNLLGRADTSKNPLLNRVVKDDWDDNDHFDQSEKPRSLNTEISLASSPTSRSGHYVRDGKEKQLVILITSDRGLAGAFNTNVINKAIELIKSDSDKEFDFITIGRKGSDTVKRLGHKIIATFPAKDRGVSISDARPIIKIAIEDYLNFKYEKVFVVYSNFISTLVQQPNILQLLPFVKTGDVDIKQDFIFEPSAEDVLDNLVKKTVEFGIYQALVEAVASEHSARMVAMRNANEAAGELIDDLSLSYNQARQAGITRELSEISAAKLAMEG